MTQQTAKDFMNLSEDTRYMIIGVQPEYRKPSLPESDNFKKVILGLEESFPKARKKLMEWCLETCDGLTMNDKGQIGSYDNSKFIPIDHCAKKFSKKYVPLRPLYKTSPRWGIVVSAVPIPDVGDFHIDNIVFEYKPFEVNPHEYDPFQNISRFFEKTINIDQE